MNREELRIKIFKRACKESECFCYKEWMKQVIESIRKGNEIFFGEFEPAHHPFQKYQFKCQLLFLKMSAEKNILTHKGTVISLEDTFKRYDCNFLREKEGRVFNLWTEVNEYSNKESIKEEIMAYAIKKNIKIKDAGYYFMPSYTAQMLQPSL